MAHKAGRGIKKFANEVGDFIQGDIIDPIRGGLDDLFDDIDLENPQEVNLKLPDILKGEVKLDVVVLNAGILGDIKTFDKRLNKFKIKEKIRKEKLDKEEDM